MSPEKFIEPEELFLFNRGELFHSHLRLGAHKVKLNQKNGVHFAVWAPNAVKVSVIGDFNNWQGSCHLMEQQGRSGVWTLFVPGLGEGELYKYELHTQAGEILHKADPFAFYAEVRPKTASLVYSLAGYSWNDNAWLQNRKNDYFRENPVLIYEVHAGSWKRKQDNSFYSYRDLAEELPAYLLAMGFTCLELLPLMEHPYDGSWGYQITGYYAATSRYGTPHDLMYLIDKCHQAGIAVVLDWVPGHFCKDAHGLGRFDGTSLFEGEEHREWGTYKFDFSRLEVWSFLISNALFWFDTFHIDGLRVDGVTSMLFLNYGIGKRGWKPNRYGGSENLEAIAFLQKLHEVTAAYYPDALLIAEESTAWPLVTRPSSEGGLGFNYKWNMGWMNDTLKYMQNPFPARPPCHNLLTFSLVYAFSENFILPLSHDEVVHGKKSLIEKMPGDYRQKFAGLRVLYLYLLCHPGKKLLFMGGEFAQFIEWRYDFSLEWFLLDFDLHAKFREYVRMANQLYCREESLWQVDQDWQGFEWLDADNSKNSILIFLRKARQENNYVVVVLNFQPQGHENFRIGVPCPGIYSEILNTEQYKFGGSGQRNPERMQAQAISWHGKKYSLSIKVPPLGGVIFKPNAEYA